MDISTSALSNAVSDASALEAAPHETESGVEALPDAAIRGVAPGQWEDMLVKNKARLDALLSQNPPGRMDGTQPQQNSVRTAQTSVSAVSSSSSSPPSVAGSGPSFDNAVILAASTSAVHLRNEAGTPRSPLTPLEISAMGPLLDTMQPLEIPSVGGGKERGTYSSLQQESAPQQSCVEEDFARRVASFERERADFLKRKTWFAMDRMSQEGAACIEANRVRLSDSLAMKRQVWLDASAAMWQQTAQKQADDALQTAKTLKLQEEEWIKKERDLTARTTALSEKEKRWEITQEEALRLEDTLRDRKQRLLKLENEMEKRGAELQLLENAKKAESDTMSTALFFKMEGLKAREEDLAQREANAEGLPGRIAEVEKKELQIEADVLRLELLETNLTVKEKKFAGLEEALEMQHREYSHNRERLLFEYADLAERERHLEATQQATKDNWNAACAQQADAKILHTASLQRAGSAAQHLISLAELHTAHSSEVVAFFHEAASSVVSYAHYVRQRAMSRVVPAPERETHHIGASLSNIYPTLPLPLPMDPREGSGLSNGAASTQPGMGLGIAGGGGGGLGLASGPHTPRGAYAKPGGTPTYSGRVGPAASVRTGVMSPTMYVPFSWRGNVKGEKIPSLILNRSLRKESPQTTRHLSLENIENSLRQRYGAAPLSPTSAERPSLSLSVSVREPEQQMRYVPLAGEDSI